MEHALTAPLLHAVARRGALPLVAALLLAACTRSDPGPPPSPPPTTAAPTQSTDDTEAADRIPVEGTAEAPVRWRVTAPGGEGQAAAVLAARRFLALQHVGAAAEHPGDLAPLYAAVTRGRLAEIWTAPRDATVPPPQRSAGPLFVWITGATEVTEGLTAVDVCRDLGWVRRGPSTPTARGPVTGVSRLIVEREPGTGTGAPVWKVTSHVDPATDLLGPPAVEACNRWSATHTSPDSPA